MRLLGQVRWGMACLAITHSVPVASLLWSYVIQHMVTSLQFHSHITRITLFSTALAIQIFGPKDFATVVTLGTECLVLILFWVVSRFVMHLLSWIYAKEHGDDGDDGDDIAEEISFPRESQHDVEEGLDK